MIIQSIGKLNRKLWELRRKGLRNKLPLSFNHITFLLYLLKSYKDLHIHPRIYLTEYSSQPFDSHSHEDQVLRHKTAPVLSQPATSGSQRNGRGGGRAGEEQMWGWICAALCSMCLCVEIPGISVWECILCVSWGWFSAQECVQHVWEERGERQRQDQAHQLPGP